MWSQRNFRRLVTDFFRFTASVFNCGTGTALESPQGHKTFIRRTFSMLRPHRWFEQNFRNRMRLIRTPGQCEFQTCSKRLAQVVISSVPVWTYVYAYALTI